MAKKRLNVTDVAEVLIDEINAFKAESVNLRATIEQLKNSKIQLDDESLNKLHAVNDEVKTNLNSFSKAIAEQESHVSKWVVYLVAFFSLLSIGSIIFGVFQYSKKAAPEREEYTQLEQLLKDEIEKNAYHVKYLQFMKKKNPNDTKIFIDENPVPDVLKNSNK